MIVNTYKILLISIETNNPYLFPRLQASLNSSKGWIRFMQHSYLVKTKHDSRYWYQKLKPLLKDGEHIFITKIDMEDKQGWLPKTTWDFIRNLS